jgi:oxygen-independent coproporphyrinogen-3 oxidase
LGAKIGFLFDELKKIKVFSPLEFTIEANPESITETFLRSCREGGVNRISLGVQTFNEKSRNAVGRTQGLSENELISLYSKLSLVSQYYKDDFSVDLITGLPFQDEKIILEDINKVMEYKPSHISLYSLTVEHMTPLDKKIKSKKIMLPNQDFADSLWITGKDALVKAGFEHYEISNFALKNKKCIHNMRYWQMKSYLGAGPCACGTIIDEDTGKAKRFTYPACVDSYKNAPFFSNTICEELDRLDLLKDTFLMGYRYKEGPDAELFKQRFGCSIEDKIPKTLKKWKDKDKMLYLNSFLEQIFDELENQSEYAL